MTAPGWYYAEGDAPGTTRYWDGTQWVGDPVHTPDSPTYGGFSSPGGGQPMLRVASVGKRIGGRLIDFVITLIIFLVLAIPVITDIIDDIDALGPNPTEGQIENVLTDAINTNTTVLLLFAGVGLLWDFVWTGLLGGTPGKLILGMRVARADNGATPPGWGKAALRSLNRLIALVPGLGGLISLLIGLASLIMLFVDDQNRTVMDRVASTVVIDK